MFEKEFLRKMVYRERKRKKERYREKEKECVG
jgi:hypothetical protein